jgi:hypothetical protein
LKHDLRAATAVVNSLIFLVILEWAGAQQPSRPRIEHIRRTRGDAGIALGAATSEFRYIHIGI